MSNVLITTGDLKEDYEIIDAVFTFIYGAPSAFVAFDKVKEGLRNKASELGGDAVINCSFEYNKSTTGSGFGGPKTVFEMYAYGTVVRLH